MGIKCRIKRSGGSITVINPDGRTPLVFSEAQRVLQNDQRALDAWASTYTEQFTLATGKNSETATFEDVVKFLDSSVEVEPMSLEDRYSIANLMQANGIESLSELSQILNRIFKPQGVFEVNESAAVRSGIYSSEEIQNIDVVQILNTLKSIDNQLLIEDMAVAPSRNVFQFKDPSQITSLGTYRNVSDQDIMDELSRTVENTEDLNAKVQELPYQDFVDRFNNSVTFKNQITEQFSNLKKVPILRFLNGELTDSDISTYETVKNTLEQEYDTQVLTELEAQVRFLEEVDPVDWTVANSEVNSLLKKIESKLSEQAVDVVGISNISKQQTDVLDLLSSTLNMMNNPVEVNIQSFSSLYDQFLKTDTDSFYYSQVDPVYKDLNIVSLESEFSDQELFETQGLIKIADGLYHKVARGQQTELYDYLYNQVLDGSFIIPEELRTYSDLNNKTEVLKDLTTLVMSRETYVNNGLQEELSLNQIVFNHLPIQRQTNLEQDISSLSELEFSEEYLTGDFVSDFYKYVLQEKVKNSEIYASTLSKFKITGQDISLNSSLENIENLKYSAELKEYFKLKKDSRTKHLYEQSQANVIEDLYFLNNTSQIKQIQTEILNKEREYLIVRPTSDNFIKVGQDIYRKKFSKDNAELFQRLKTSDNNIYYSANNNFSSDMSDAKRYFDSVNLEIISVNEIPQINNSQISQQILDSNLNLLNLYSETEVINTEDCAG